DDAKVAATAANCPEQVGVFASAGSAQLAVGGDDVHREQVVAAEAIRPAEPADATTKRKPSDARGRDDAAGGRQAKRLRLPVELCPGEASLGADSLPIRIHTDAFHRRYVDHDPAIAHTAASRAVSAGVDSNLQIAVAPEVDRVDDVGWTDAAGDH